MCNCGPISLIQLHPICGKSEDKSLTTNRNRQRHEVEHAVFVMACQTYSHNASNESSNDIMDNWTN